MMHSEKTGPEKETLDSKEQRIACGVFLDMSNHSPEYLDSLRRDGY